MIQPELMLDHYAVYEAIASGGMGTIHLGRILGSVGFARTVVVKRLRAKYVDDAEFVSSFIDEARLAARIRHPNVVSPLDVVAEHGELFMVLEYVHGETLSRLMPLVISRNERVPVPTAVSIAVGVLLGLHAAHDARNESGAPLRIVHRDVSPQNVIVGADGHARGIDFGIAKAVGRLRTTHKDAPTVRGKIAYMAPEQLVGDPLDHRADVYAASIVLWELLCAKRMIQSDDLDAIAARVLKGFGEPPSQHAPDVPKAIDDIVLRGLRRDPAERWPTARAMAFALEASLTPATASQVGGWVSRIAGPSLAARAARIAEIESTVIGDRLSQMLGEVRATNRPKPL